MVVDRRELEDLIPALRRYARGLCTDPAAADDLVQDCLVLALDREHQYRGGSLAGWVFAILTNLDRSRHRARKRAVPLDPGADPPDGGSDPAMRVALTAALADLPAEQRQVLLLVAVEGFTYQDVATMLDIPVGTVMSRLWRARTLLAARLQGAAVVPLRRRQ